MFSKKTTKPAEHAWIRHHKRVDKSHEYYVKQEDFDEKCHNNIMWNDMGDGIHCFDVVKYKEDEHARHICQLLNIVLSDDKIFELVAKKIDNKEYYVPPVKKRAKEYHSDKHDHKCGNPDCKGYDPEF